MFQWPTKQCQLVYWVDVKTFQSADDCMVDVCENAQLQIQDFAKRVAFCMSKWAICSWDPGPATDPGSF